MKVNKTKRGFWIVNFKDQHGTECSIQKSSLATQECIWFGADKTGMHLTRKQVAGILPILQKFVETGNL